jgi:hypothetical protein
MLPDDAPNKVRDWYNKNCVRPRRSREGAGFWLFSCSRLQDALRFAGLAIIAFKIAANLFLALVDYNADLDDSCVNCFLHDMMNDRPARQREHFFGRAAGQG